MYHKKPYLIGGIAGLSLIVLGQILARPRFYGSTPGRAWAHVFWLGFLLLMGSALVWFTKYVAQHDDPAVVRAGRYQIFGIAGITCLIGLLTIASVISRDPSFTAYHSHAGRGMFALWLLLSLLFTIANILVLAIRRFSRT
jgi:hypothetical protein